jgi:hypothetical protein
MRKHLGYLHSFIASVLALSLAAALSLAFAADLPTGTYASKGNITLTLDGQGQFRVTEGKVMKVAGSYVVKGDQLQLTDKGGPWACRKSGEQSGTYTWKLDDSVLTLVKVTDPCTDRVGSLTMTSWKQAR